MYSLRLKKMVTLLLLIGGSYISSEALAFSSNDAGVWISGHPNVDPTVLISTPNVITVTEIVEPVIERTVVDGDVTVSSCVEYNDNECSPAEEGGFFSIVSAKDIN